MLKERAEKIVELLTNKRFADAQALLIDMNEVDIAELFSLVPNTDMLLMFRILPKTLAAEVFAYLEKDDQTAIVSAFTDAELAPLLKQLFIDDVADLVEEVPANVASKILKNADEAERSMINQILQYPDDSAGSIMTTEYVVLKKHMTVEQAITSIRKNGLKKETIYTCYVTDANRILQGIISLRKLVLSNPTRRIEDIYEDDFIYVNTNDDQETAAKKFKKYGFIALPVVDNEKRLVGIITVDDIMHIMEQEATEDFHKMAAMQPSEDRYLDTSAFNLAKHRILWLMLLMVTQIFTGGIIERFTTLLAHYTILTAFIPMIMGTGGNSGNQSSTLIIRGLATGEITTADWLKVVWKEMSIAIYVSLILGGAMFIKNFFISHKELIVSLTVSLTLCCTIVIAKTTGALLPMLAKKLKIDPATMAAPMITTFVDTISLLIYFSLAGFLLFN